MTVVIIIASICIAAIAWFRLKKPALKGVPARTWPASRAKLGVKPKLSTPL